MTHGDLFAGIGGFALAAQWCGIKTIWAVEIDRYCQAVYRKHFLGVEMYGDVKEIMADAESRGSGAFGATDEQWTSGTSRRIGKAGRSLPPVDLLTGGFPCQPFSVAGKR